MSGHSDLVVGWCPGALRPMASGDGLIVRVRPRLGAVSLMQLDMLATAARRFGDGNLYLSNRANVQIRGVTGEEHCALLDVLAAANLMDSDPRIEAVRNVMLVPALGPGACAGTAGDLAAKLEERLAKTGSLHALPGKFGAVVQTGSVFDASAISDINLLVQKDRIAMVLDGDTGRAVFFEGIDAAADGFVRTASAFLELRKRDPDIRRMRTAVLRHGVDGVARDAGFAAEDIGLTIRDAPAPIGDLGEAFGMAFAFGEITQAALLAITAAMLREGITKAAISPHRALLFPAGGQSKAALLKLAAGIGAIIDPGDLRLRVHGCPGAPSCSRATVAARRGSEDVLAALEDVPFPSGTVHISGCEKRCAYPHEADITAIGADGRYTVTGPRSQIRNAVPQVELASIIAEFARAS